MPASNAIPTAPGFPEFASPLATVACYPHCRGTIAFRGHRGRSRTVDRSTATRRRSRNQCYSRDWVFEHHCQANLLVDGALDLHMPFPGLGTAHSDLFGKAAPWIRNGLASRD